MKHLKEVLINKFDYSEQDADEEISKAQDEALELVAEGDLESAMDICGTYWGLEPDYLEDLLL